MGKEKYNSKQLEALQTLDKNVIVSAGAGSGKTKVLSNRFLEIIERYHDKGINADNILAITFTIKAAAEMKERVRKNMLERMEADLIELHSNDISKPRRDELSADYALWNVQLKKLEQAQVSTIDSLCTRILRENILAAGIAPSSEMIEDYDNHEFYDQCESKFIHYALCDTVKGKQTQLNKDFRTLVNEYDLYYTRKMLKELMKQYDTIFASAEGKTEKQFIKELQSKYDFDKKVFIPIIEAYKALIEKLDNPENGLIAGYKCIKNKYEEVFRYNLDLQLSIDDTNSKHKILVAEVKSLEAQKKEVKVTGNKELLETISKKLTQAKIDKDIKFKELKELKSKLQKVDNAAKNTAEKYLPVCERLLIDLNNALKEIETENGNFDTYRREILGLKDDTKGAPDILKIDLPNLKKSYKDISPFANNVKAKALIPSWIRVLKAFKSYFQDAKDEANILTFEDIEKKALALLQNNEQVRRKYQKQFIFLMIDEFQDTNELQKKLAYLLYGDSVLKLQKAPNNAYKNAELKNLFVVGDPKQSIYRFRGADVTVFKAVRDDMIRADDNNKGFEIEMAKNYRSDHNILTICNQFFPPVMGKDKQKPVYYENLQWEPNLRREGLPVEFIDIPSDDRSEEAMAIAQRIKELVDEGRKYSDITILMRAMTHANDFTDVFLKEGIPYVVSSGQGFYQKQEIVDILAIFRSATNKTCTADLVGALSSPYFSLDSKEITELAITGGLWTILTKYNDDNFKICNAATKLNIIKNKSERLGLKEFWQEMWHILDVENVLLSLKNGGAMLANVEKLKQEAILFSEQPDGTLENWLTRVISMQSDSELKIPCAVEASEDAVNIMTIHGSKGLQFPVTIIPMLDSDHQDNDNNISFDAEEGLGIKVVNSDQKIDKTSVSVAANRANSVLEDEERARLLYVAMTRAEEHLILSGLGDKEKDDGQDVKKQVIEVSDEKGTRAKSWYKQIQQVMPAAKADHVETEKVNSFIRKATKIVDGVVSWIMNSDLGVSTEIDKKTNRVEKMKKISVRTDISKLNDYDKIGSTVFTPTSLQTYASCQKSYYYQYVLGIPGLADDEIEAYIQSKSDSSESDQSQEPSKYEYRGELNAPLYGNLIHRALELFGNGGYTLREAYNQSQIDNKVSENDCGKAYEMLETYVNSDLYQEQIAKSAKLYNEYKFAYYINGEFKMIGVIDCLAIDADGNMHIIDYKTGPYHEENKGYGIQLALYREVAKNMFCANNEHVNIDCKLHYIPDCKQWDLDGNGKHDYLATAIETFNAISEKSAEEDFKCVSEKKGYCDKCRYCFMCPNAPRKDKINEEI